MKHSKKYKESKFVKSAILGVSGLMITASGKSVIHIAGMNYKLNYFSKSPIDEIFMIIELPLFFIVASLTKIIIS